MTKKEVVAAIAEKTGMDRSSISAIVEEFMREIVSAVVDGKTVHLRFFGSFSTKKRASKPARNIKENTTITIPERNIPYFKPSGYFKQEVIESGVEIIQKNLSKKSMKTK